MVIGIEFMYDSYQRTKYSRPLLIQLLWLRHVWCNLVSPLAGCQTQLEESGRRGRESSLPTTWIKVCYASIPVT